jgi:hypothetical protein
MNPKKATRYYKQVAEDLNIEESLVEDFIEFYYKNIRFCLSHLIHPRINVDGLGHFVAKPSWVKRSIERISKSLDKYDTYTFGAYAKKIRMGETLDLLIQLEKKILTEDQRKKSIKQSKHESSLKSNLGE